MNHRIGKIIDTGEAATAENAQASDSSEFDLEDTKTRRTLPRTPLPFRRLKADEMVVRTKAYANAMEHRRSVRNFSTEPFPLEILDDAIRAASTAPSGAHQQPWTFVVVTDIELKQQIRAAAEVEERKNWHGRMPPEWVAAVAPFGIDWHKDHLTDAPALIVVFAQAWSGVMTEGLPTRHRKHYYVDESVGIAVGMLLSALHLGGLATLTHTPSPMAFLRQLLGRPNNERAFLVIPVGYPAEGADVPALQRKSLDEVRVLR
jgi:iodotyrosine deiodinase